MPAVKPHPSGVSLIICVFNGAGRIAETLDHICNQVTNGHFAWEVVVVDDASTDGTAEIIRKNWKSVVPLKIVREDHRGMAYARFRGIREASFEYLSFIDDDNHIGPGWVETVYNTFLRHPEIAMCGGTNTGRYETTPPAWMKDLEKCLAVGRQGETTADVTRTRRYLWGAGLSFRKSLFEQVEAAGFPFLLKGRTGMNLTAGEDTELCLAFIAAGYHLWYIESLTLEHAIPAGRLTWDYGKNLFRALGKAEYFLDLYRLEIDGTGAPFLVMHLRLSKTLVLYSGWRLAMFILFRDQKHNPRYLSYLAGKAYIHTALPNMVRFGGYMKQIRLFRARVRSAKTSSHEDLP